MIAQKLAESGVSANIRAYSSADPASLDTPLQGSAPFCADITDVPTRSRASMNRTTHTDRGPRATLVLAASSICALLVILLGMHFWMEPAAQIDVLGKERLDRKPAGASAQPTTKPESSSRVPFAASSTDLARTDQAGNHGGSQGTISGRIVDTNGNPIAKVNCSLSVGKPSWGPAATAAVPGLERATEPAANSANTNSASTLSSADGHFSITAGSGYWQLEFEADSYALLRVDHLQAGDYREFELSTAHQLTVQVTESGGKRNGLPIADVQVSLVDSFRDLPGRPLDQQRTDREGKAVLKRAFPGEAYLRFKHPEYQYQLEIIHLPAMTQWHTLEFQLSKGVAVQGVVVAGATGEPVPNASVRIESYGKGQSIQSELPVDGNARFGTEHDFTPGERIQLSAYAEGYARSTTLVVVQPEPGTTAFEAEVRLSPDSKRIIGRAVDSKALALEGALVTLIAAPPVQPGREALLSALTQVSPHHERWSPVAQSDSHGDFVIEGLSKHSTYVLMLTKDGFAPRIEWVDVQSSEPEARLGSLVLNRSGSIFGRAQFEADLQPMVGERVRAQFEIILSETGFESEFDTWRPTVWWRPLEAKVAADGSFRIDNVATGTYELSIGTQQFGSVFVEPGAQVGPLQLTAPFDALGKPEPLDKLQGVVSDTKGAPIEGAFVALFATEPSASDERKPNSVTRSDLRGRFTLHADAAGAFRLEVTSPLGNYQDYSTNIENWDTQSKLAIRMQATEIAPEPAIGLVLDPYGEPVASATIRIEPPENDYCGCLSFETQTDDDGVVIFQQLGDKDYRVFAFDPLGRFQPTSVFPVRPGEYFEVSFQF